MIPYDGARNSKSWLLAAGDQSKEIVIWDLQQRQPPITCRGAIWQVTALAFHPQGLFLASAGQATGKFWDARRGISMLNFATGTGSVRFLAFDSEGGRLIWGTEPGAGRPVVGIYELDFGRGITPLRGLRFAVRKVWFAPDGRRLAALSDEWQVGIWEMKSRKLVSLLESPFGNLADNAGGAFDETGDRFAFASWKEACLFDLKSGQTIQRWPLVEGFTDQLQFDPQGRLLLLRREPDADSRRWIWRLHELTKHPRPVLLHQQTDTNWLAHKMTFISGGERFLVWNGWPSEKEQTLRAFEVSSGQEIWRIATGRTNGDMRVCLDPSGRSFGHHVSSGQQQLRLFRLSDFQPIGFTAKGCNAIGPNGEQFLIPACFRSDQTGDGGFPLWTDWTELSYVCAFSPDGTLVAWGTQEGEILVAHLDTVSRRLDLLGNSRFAR